jgi:hypothetical protein
MMKGREGIERTGRKGKMGGRKGRKEERKEGRKDPANCESRCFSFF